MDAEMAKAIAADGKYQVSSFFTVKLLVCCNAC
jgi:hypothetical protein